MIDPPLATRINKIGNLLMQQKDELLDQKQFLMAFLNEFCTDIKFYLSVKPILKNPDTSDTHITAVFGTQLTERYWYEVVFPMWINHDDPKFNRWMDKLLQGEPYPRDHDLVTNLVRQIKSDFLGDASHRYILDLSMATDLIASHIPSDLFPVFVQLKGIPQYRNQQRNPDFVNEQQKWSKTCEYWNVKRALLISHDHTINEKQNLSNLAGFILEQSRSRPELFIDTFSLKTDES